jgi:hypothetical protein
MRPLPNDLLAGEPIPLTAQIKAVERELAMRRSVYPRQVAARKMPQAKADQEIAAMEAVLATLLVVARERFGGA